MKNKYVLITPVHNEEQYIKYTLDSVVEQTVPPYKWVIVDDRSTDRTGEIVSSYEKRYDFIGQLRPEQKHTESYYAYRTRAVLAGYESVKNMEFDFVAFLDADLSIEPNYYECILKEFEGNPRLGVATGVYLNKIHDRMEKVIRDHMSTPGGLQMFRRECYESIGGYRLMKYGGDDSLADIMARMNGWETRSFAQYQAIHRRRTGTGAGRNVLAARFRQGLTEYGLGTHPVFMLAKSFRRMLLEKPYVIGSLVRFIGFSYGYWLGEERKIPADVISFVRGEQIGRLICCNGRH